MLSWRRFGLGLVVIVVCVAFALKALLLVDATSLWSDELYSVGKSFQLSFMALLAMLSNDTHPPLYSTILWLWGQSVGQNALTLRLLACLAGLWAWWCRDGAPVRSLGSVVRGIAGTDFIPGSSAGFLQYLTGAFCDRRQELCLFSFVCSTGLVAAVAFAASSIENSFCKCFPFVWLHGLPGGTDSILWSVFVCGSGGLAYMEAALAIGWHRRFGLRVVVQSNRCAVVSTL
jgi:hypothetical protein